MVFLVPNEKRGTPATSVPPTGLGVQTPRICPQRGVINPAIHLTSLRGILKSLEDGSALAGRAQEPHPTGPAAPVHALTHFSELLRQPARRQGGRFSRRLHPPGAA